MTSPAQLKYLDAMGIPVWVSRDIVVQDCVETLAENKEDPLEHIMHDLEEQLTPPVVSTPKAPEKTPPLIKTVTLDDSEPQANELGRTALHTAYICGSLNADWMVIGESPELTSDRKNQPYEGEQGILLTNMLRAVGIENPRENACLVNILKSSINSTAELEEQSNSQLQQLLMQKIAEVKPKVLLVVGQIAAQRLLQSKEPLARLRAKQHHLSEDNIPLVVTYYPSYLLSKPIDKRKAWEDLKLAMRFV